MKQVGNKLVNVQLRTVQKLDQIKSSDESYSQLFERLIDLSGLLKPGGGV